MSEPASTGATTESSPAEVAVVLDDRGHQVVIDGQGREIPKSAFDSMPVNEQQIVLEGGLDAWREYQRERQRWSRLQPHQRQAEYRKKIRKQGGVMAAIAKTFDADAPVSIDDIVAAGYDAEEVNQIRTQLEDLSSEELTTLQTRGMTGLKSYWSAQKQDRERASKIILQSGGIEQAIAQGWVQDSILMRAGFQQEDIDAFKAALATMTPPARELVETGGLRALEQRQAEITESIKAGGGIEYALANDLISVADAALVYPAEVIPQLEAMKQVGSAGGVMQGMASGVISPDTAVIAGYPRADVERALQYINQMPEDQRAVAVEKGWAAHEAEIAHARRQWEEYAYSHPEGVPTAPRDTPSVRPMTDDENLDPSTIMRIAPSPDGRVGQEVIERAVPFDEFAEIGTLPGREVYDDDGRLTVKVKDDRMLADELFALPASTQRALHEYGPDAVNAAFAEIRAHDWLDKAVALGQVSEETLAVAGIPDSYAAQVKAWYSTMPPELKDALTESDAPEFAAAFDQYMSRFTKIGDRYYEQSDISAAADQFFASHEIGQGSDIDVVSESGERLIRIQDGFVPAEAFFALPPNTQKFLIDHGIEPYRRELAIRDAPVTPPGERDDPVAHAAMFGQSQGATAPGPSAAPFIQSDPYLEHLERQLTSYKTTGDLSPQQLQNLLLTIGDERRLQPSEVQVLRQIQLLTPAQRRSDVGFDVRPILNQITAEQEAALTAAIEAGTLTMSLPDSRFGLQTTGDAPALISAAGRRVLDGREWASLPEWAARSAALAARDAGLLQVQWGDLPESVKNSLGPASAAPALSSATRLTDLSPAERAVLDGPISLVQPANYSTPLESVPIGPGMREFRMPTSTQGLAAVIAKIEAGQTLTPSDLDILAAAQSPEATAAMFADFGSQLSSPAPSAQQSVPDVLALIDKARTAPLGHAEWNSLPRWAVFNILSTRAPLPEELPYLTEPIRDYFASTAAASQRSDPTSFGQTVASVPFTPEEVRQLRLGPTPEPAPDLRQPLGMYSAGRTRPNAEDALAELFTFGTAETQAFNNASVSNRYFQAASQIGREYDEKAGEAAKRGEQLTIPKYAYIDQRLGRPDEFTGRIFDAQPTAGETAFNLAIGAVPLVNTVRFWDDSSWLERGLNLGLDTLSVVPAAAITSGLRRAGLSGLQTTKELAALEARGAVEAFIRPDRAIRTVGHTVEPLVSPGRLPTSAVEIRTSTVRLPESELGSLGSLRARDELTAMAIQGVDPVTTVAGKRVELATTPLQRHTGPASIHTTHDIRAFMDGAVVTEGREGGMFLAPTLHSRFLPSSAFGDAVVDGIPGALVIRDPGLLSRFRSSGKLYKGTAEIESVLPPGTRIPPPSQYLHIRDPAGNKVVLAVIGEKFSPTEIAKLKVLGARDTLLNIFRKPVNIRSIRVYEKLSDDAVRATRRSENLQESAQAARAAGRIDEAVGLERQATVALQEAREAATRAGAMLNVSAAGRMVSTHTGDQDITQTLEAAAGGPSFVEPPTSFARQGRASGARDAREGFRPTAASSGFEREGPERPMQRQLANALPSRIDPDRPERARDDDLETKLDIVPRQAERELVALRSQTPLAIADRIAAFASRNGIDLGTMRAGSQTPEDLSGRAFRALDPAVTLGRPPTIRIKPVRTPDVPRSPVGRRRTTNATPAPVRPDSPTAERTPPDLPPPERVTTRPPAADFVPTDPPPTERIPSAPPVERVDATPPPPGEFPDALPPPDRIPVWPPPSSGIPVRPPVRIHVPDRPLPPPARITSPPPPERVPPGPAPTIRVPTSRPPPPERVPPGPAPTTRVPTSRHPPNGTADRRIGGSSRSRRRDGGRAARSSLKRVLGVRDSGSGCWTTIRGRRNSSSNDQPGSLTSPVRGPLGKVTRRCPSMMIRRRRPSWTWRCSRRWLETSCSSGTSDPAEDAVSAEPSGGSPCTRAPSWRSWSFWCSSSLSSNPDCCRVLCRRSLL